MASPADAQQSGQIAALVLAGGRATRLGGADKPGLTIAGRSLISTVAGAAVGAGACRVVIVGPPRPGLAAELRGTGQPPAGPAGLSVEFTTEQPPGAGPVPAVRAGLELIAEPWLILLAADLPFLRDTHVRALLASAAASAAPGAMLVDGQGRPQWLASCWRTASLRTALAAYLGSSLGGVLGPLRPAEVTAGLAPGQPPPWLDCDTNEDLAAAVAFGAVQEPLERDSPDQRGSR